MKHSLGFTLIELLVSMAMLSMIILIGSSAIGMLGQNWDGRLGNFDDKVRQAKHSMLVQDVLDSLIPYVAYNDNGKPVIYFEGNRNGFVAVSSQSVFGGDEFAVVRFSVRQNIDLSFDVIYEESGFVTEDFDTISRELEFSYPIVLFESVTDPKFRYFGLSEEEMKRSNLYESDVPQPEWMQSYISASTLRSPLKASLRFDNSKGAVTILSNLAGQPRGLLSKFKANPSKMVSGPDISEDNDECFC